MATIYAYDALGFATGEERDAPDNLAPQGWAFDPPPTEPGKVARYIAGVWYLVAEEHATAERAAAAERALIEARAAAVDRINREAGEARARFITDTVGQEGTYLRKLEEAKAKASGGAGPFPYLEREAHHLGVTADDVAVEVLATATAWDQTINPEIEGLRRSRTVAARAAASPEELEALFPIPWPEPA